MNVRYTLLIILFSLITAALTGCSGGSANSPLVDTLSASKGCIGCHATNNKSISAVTGVRITDEWQRSTHNTARGAGCPDCHGYVHYHDNNADCRSCHGTAHTDKGKTCVDCHGGNSTFTADCLSCHTNVHKDPNNCNQCHKGTVPVAVAMKNPDAAGKCFDCHLRTFSAVHFRNMTAGANAVSSAMYVTRNYEKSCSSCHEPHNPLNGLGKAERKAWAASGHGNVNGLAWSKEDFKKNVNCIHCHTSTGFINYVESNYTLPKGIWAAAGDQGREVLTCTACHANNDFRAAQLRPAAAYTAPYGITNGVARATALFSNQGESTVCFPCHVGSENGDSLIAGNFDFTNTPFVDPHKLVSAAVWQGKAGFRFYTSSARYGVNRPTHGVLTPDLESVTISISSANTNLSDAETKGSCVVCHLGGKGSHSFNPYAANKFSSPQTDTGCLGCHSGTNYGYDRYYPTAATQPTNLTSGGYVQQRALDFLKYQFRQVAIYYNSDKAPYFFANSPYTAPVRNWTTQVTGGTGLQTMGAAMNLRTLAADRGAAAHNATFTRGIIADSLVYLQKGTVGNRSIAYADPNSIIAFGAYSAAITPAGGGAPIDGNPATIANLKGFLIKMTSGLYTRM